MWSLRQLRYAVIPFVGFGAMILVTFVISRWLCDSVAPIDRTDAQYLLSAAFQGLISLLGFEFIVFTLQYQKVGTDMQHVMSAYTVWAATGGTALLCALCLSQLTGYTQTQVTGRVLWCLIQTGTAVAVAIIQAGYTVMITSFILHIRSKKRDRKHQG